MKITDEMVMAALLAIHENDNIYHMTDGTVRDMLTAALATQPDSYAQGFERAREMAAHLVDADLSPGLAAELSEAIRNMEMPDE